MGTERVIDLANQRYADRPYEGPLPVSGSAEEAARAAKQRRALLRLKIRAAGGDDTLADLLTILGLDE
jgi:hypothetical protein